MNVIQPIPPATGVVRWVGQAANGNRLLQITPTLTDGLRGETQTYEVAPVDGGYDLHTVKRSGEFKCYRIRHFVGSTFTCDCPDAMTRSDRRCACKHIRGLLAALRSDKF